MWNELLTGVISPKAKLIRVAAIFNTLVSLDDDHPLDENLSNVAIIKLPLILWKCAISTQPSLVDGKAQWNPLNV